MSDIKDSDGNTTSHYLSYGVMWLLILVGLGACQMMGNHDAHTPLISIQSTHP